jgi:hypothetical protein
VTQPAEGAAVVPAPPSAPGPPAPPARPSGGDPTPHAPRFQFLLGAFGALGVAAVAIAVALAMGPKAKPAPPWSSWKPSGDVDPAVQIAEHVAPEYLLAPGKPLVSVSGGPQASGGQPVVVALRTSGSAPAALPENGVMYQLCGSGPNGSIPGKPSNARGLLVRREALELALYTFHYVSGASQVIVTYPPLPPSSPAKKGATPEEAQSTCAAQTRGRVLLFRPQDLTSQLAQPLDVTLAGSAPTVATVERAPEARLVNALTGPLLYSFELTVQQSTPVLLLQSPSLGG